MNCQLTNKKIFLNLGFLIIGIIIIIFVIIPKTKSISQITAKRQTNNLTTSANLPNLEEVTKQAQSIKNQLPEASSFTLPLGQELTLITTCEQLAKKNNLNLKINLNSETKEISNQIFKRDLSLELTGEYSNIYKFINQLEKNLTSVQVKLVNVSADSVHETRAIISGQSYWLNPNL